MAWRGTSSTNLGVSPHNRWRESMWHIGQLKLMGVLTALGFTGLVAAQYGFSRYTFFVGEKEGILTAPYVARNMTGVMENTSALDVMSHTQTPPATWLFWITVIYVSLGWIHSSQALTSGLWTALAGWQFPQGKPWWATFGVMTGAALCGILPHTLLGYGLIPAASGELRGWLTSLHLLLVPCITAGFVIAWPLHYRAVSFSAVRSPVAFAIGYTALLTVGSTITIFLLTPAFSAGTSGQQILIRLVVLPLYLEVLQAVARGMARVFISPTIPSHVMVVLTLPIVTFGAVLGRFFTTSADSFATSLFLSVAIAGIETVMRVTVLGRDAVYGWLWARVPACCKCCGRGKVGGEQDARWSTRRDLRAFYSFLLIDSLCEDVAMLLMLPTVALFRIPATPGGTPLSVGDTTLRVGVQLLLELGTDMLPFAAYGVLHWAWGERLGYREVPAVSAVRAWSVGMSAPKLKDAEVVCLDDSVAEGMAAGPSQRSSGDSVSSFGSQASSTGSTKLPAPDSWSSGCCRCFCVLCPPARDTVFTDAVTSAHVASLADEHNAVWEPLSAPKAQQAMKPGSQPSPLFWPLFISDVASVRLIRAFDTRPAGWTLTFLLMFSSIYSYFLQVHFAPTERCLFVEPGSGEEYFDYCSARAA